MKRESFSVKMLAFILLFCLIALPLSVDRLVIAQDKGNPSALFDTNLTLPGPADITSDVVIGTVSDGLTLSDLSVTSPAASFFSFTSDDGSNNDWSYRDVFISRGVSCTVPLIENYVSGRSGWTQVSKDNMLKLQNEYGYEIGSHSYDHVKLSSLPYYKLVEQLTESKRSLTEMGFYINNMFLPFGDYNQTVLDEAKKEYRSVRTSDKGNNKPLDKGHLKVHWLDGGVSLDQAKSEVDQARDVQNQFVIFGFHADVANRSFMEDTIGVLIDYIQQFDNTRVLTVDKVLDRLENTVNQVLDYRVENRKIILSRFFIRSLPFGENTLTLRFSDNSAETLTLTIDRNAEVSYSITWLNPSNRPVKTSALSTNNYLSSLSVRNFALSPRFDKSVLKYIMSVPNDITSLNIASKAENGKASVRISGNSLVAGKTNTVSITVTSQSGSKRVYSVEVYRADITAPSGWAETTQMPGESNPTIKNSNSVSDATTKGSDDSAYIPADGGKWFFKPVAIVAICFVVLLCIIAGLGASIQIGKNNQH